jgi:hypothetical protein
VTPFLEDMSDMLGIDSAMLWLVVQSPVNRDVSVESVFFLFQAWIAWEPFPLLC